MRILTQISNLRRYSTQSVKSHFVTTPIFYVNAAPHIGHLYTAVITDAINRFQQLIEPNCRTIFSTGTDEHGTKIQQAAANHKISPKEYCDQISSMYQRLFQEADVNPTRFIRTTDHDHGLAVGKFWETLVKKDLIYSQNYSGWYCVSDETFLSEKQLKVLPSGEKVSEESGHPVEWTDELNYMFRLSKFQEQIIHWAESDNVIKPSKYQKILLRNLRDELPDLSVSRPSSRVSWGINVPGDSTQTIYVWLDALINYLTVIGYPDNMTHWPPDIQVLGKDILKFHGIYWPAFLIAAGLDPPKQLFVHSHWTVDGQKMSKSKFNVVDPFETAKTYTMEGLRYFLLREGVAHSDGNYSETKILRMLNAELADTFGNLLSRCCAKSLNPKQIIPEASPEALKELEVIDEYKIMKNLLNDLPDTCFKNYTEHNFYLVVDAVIAVLHANNKFFEVTKPWEFKNSLNTLEVSKLNTIIAITTETLRQTAIILQPIIPKLTATILDKLNVSCEDRHWHSIKKSVALVRPLGQSSSVIFKRIIPSKLEEKAHPQKTNKSRKTIQAQS